MKFICFITSRSRVYAYNQGVYGMCITYIVEHFVLVEFSIWRGCVRETFDFNSIILHSCNCAILIHLGHCDISKTRYTGVLFYIVKFVNKLQIDIIWSKCLNYDYISVRSSQDYTDDVIDNTFTRTEYNNLAINNFFKLPNDSSL